MSFDPTNFNVYNKVKLTEKEQDILNDWFTRTYDAKYPKVGYIKNKSE